MATHFLAIIIPIVVCVTAALNFQFFSWHPICMVIAYAFLMTEAVMMFSATSSLIPNYSRPDKVVYHGYIMAGVLLAALQGFAVIYLNKERNGKEHFTTWHGIVGVITVGYTVLQAIAGIALKYNATLVSYLPRSFTLAKWKLYHALSGCFLFILGCAALLAGLYSSWFQNNTNEYVWGLTMVSGLLLTFIAVGHMSDFVKSKQPVPPTARSTPRATK
uniref:ascorbate ferrireductase (transmembrane) n=1 Tax=Plectus sambesii TaxID=2011161 RepID=A0A914W6K4_9BILA